MSWQLIKSLVAVSNSLMLGGGGDSGFVSSVVFFLAARFLASAFLQACLKVSVMTTPRQPASAARAKRPQVGGEARANQCRRFQIARATIAASRRDRFRSR